VTGEADDESECVSCNWCDGNCCESTCEEYKSEEGDEDKEEGDGNDGNDDNEVGGNGMVDPS
jgi:hypothetical protein